MKIIPPLGLALTLSLAVLVPLRDARAGQGQELQGPRVRTHDALVVHSSGLEALFVDPRDAGLLRVVRMLDDRLRELELDFGGSGFPAEGVQLVHDLFAGPFTLRAGFDDPRNPATLHAQLDVRCQDGEAATRLAGTVADLLRQTGLSIAPMQNDPRVLSARTPLGPLFVKAAGDAQEPGITIAVGRVRDDALDLSDSGLPAGIRPGFHCRWDGRQLTPLFASMFASGGSEAAVALRIFELLGLAGERAPARSATLGFDRHHALLATRVDGHGTAARHSGLFTDEPLGSADFRRVPVDATFVRLAQVDVSGLPGLLEHFELGASARVREELRAMTGVDLTADLFDHLGPTVGLYGSLRTGGGGLASTVAFVETSDPGRVTAGLARLFEVAAAAGSTAARGRVSVRSWSHGEVPCTTLVFPGLPIPLELSFGVGRDALFVTLGPGALRAAIDQLSAQDSILDHGAIADEQDGLRGLARFEFFDAPRFLDRGYGTASFFAAALGNAVRSPYEPDREPGVILPPLRELSANSRPWIGRTRLEGDDLVGLTTFDRSFAARGTAVLGTGLARAYAGVASLGIVSSIAIPRLMGARLAANESAAIATLRNVTSAQAQLQAMGAIDCDGDGIGEYGSFGELSGGRPLRVRGSAGATWGRPGVHELNPPVLSATFRQLSDDGSGNAVVVRSGYVFKLWLPGASSQGVGEAAELRPGTPCTVDTDSAEQLWCCYAWPLEPGATGRRVFFVSQDGDIMQFDNLGGRYGGLTGAGGRQPECDAALTGPDLASRPAHAPQSGRDGNYWAIAR